MDGYLLTKSGINSLDGVCENACYGRQTERRRASITFNTLALLTQSSRGKKWSTLQLGYP